MVGVGTGTEHGLERATGALAHRVQEPVAFGRVLAMLANLHDGPVGQCEGADVERIAECVLGELVGPVSRSAARDGFAPTTS